MIALFFDTETTGFKREDFTPEIVQISAILQDTVTGRVYNEINLISTPNSIVPDDVAAIHGISTTTARTYGLPRQDCINIFIDMIDRCDVIVAHNIEFDIQMLECDWYPAYLQAIEKKQYCTMKESIDIVALPPGTYHQVDYSNHKPPRLYEAYEFFFQMPLENAHNAMADVRACRDVYFAIQTFKKQEVSNVT